jgi:hypothetical protein
MALPDNFHFSQGSLQDYVDCPRRFELRYLLRLAWPALQAEPAIENERFTRQGQDFHRLLYQHLSGVPAERLSRQQAAPELAEWWAAYLAQRANPGGLGGWLEGARLYPEITLAAPLGGVRLLAKFDLVAATPGGRLLILDWKTSRHRPRRAWLANRLQSRVYPYLLAQAGAQLNAGRPVDPAAVEMIYWFAAFPAEPERFPYSPARHAEDGAWLADLIAQIQATPGGGFALTGQAERCAFCQYRSLCDRGVQAGSLAQAEPGGEPDAEADLSLDFSQLGEIEY